MSKLIVNVETGETLERELNKAEKDQEAIDTAKAAAINAETQIKVQAKATAKADLLAKLGLTAEEAVLLLS
jgi:hypothetical protein